MDFATAGIIESRIPTGAWVRQRSAASKRKGEKGNADCKLECDLTMSVPDRDRSFGDDAANRYVREGLQCDCATV